MDLEASGNADDARLIFAGGEVAGLLGGPWTGPVGPVADEEVRIEGRDYMRLTAHEHFRKQAGSILGFTERLKHVELVRTGAHAFMIMCSAVDVNATPRKIKSVEKKRVFVGGALIEHQGDSWLERAGAVSLAAARDGVDRSQPDSR